MLTRNAMLQSITLLASLFAFAYSLPANLPDPNAPQFGGRIVYEKNTAPPPAVAPVVAIDRTGWLITEASDSGVEPSALPHNLTIDMQDVHDIKGLTYSPLEDTKFDHISIHKVYLSIDGESWERLAASGTWLNDDSIKETRFASTHARHVRLCFHSETSTQRLAARSLEKRAAPATGINVLTGPDPTLPRDAWQISVDSQEPGPQGYPGTGAVDGSVTTYWHTQFTGATPGFPHTFTIDQGSAIAVSGLSYLPRTVTSGSNGRIGSYTISKSTDGTTFTQVASGSWTDDANAKTVQFTVTSARYFRLTALSEAGNRGPWTSAGEINLLDGSRKFTPFTVSADSQETAAAANAATNAEDGDVNTFWHTAFSTTPVPGFPHRFIIDMKANYITYALTYTPRQDASNNGNIGVHQIDVSTDNVNWINVAEGTFLDDKTVKPVNFKPTSARYVRLTALTEAGNRGPWSSAAELAVSYASGYKAPNPAVSGLWGETIDMPIVPVAAAVLHDSGKVLTWSAYEADAFGGSNGLQTLTATFDPASGSVSQRTVTNTQHDMFCPGLSVDTQGRPIVTGGNANQRTSIYDPAADAWSSGGNLIQGRGYQGQATLSNGKTWTIGGSWSGVQGGKNGEIYDPATNAWTALPGCTVQQMLTADAAGVYRADNHGWFFGWKNATVFQAGPSAAMNWYGTSGTGTQSAAGNRGNDPDAMNGNAIMYDAVNGKILTVGGAVNYGNSPATSNAHIVTIGNPNTAASVVTIGNMAYARSFANTAVLPNGQVSLLDLSVIFSS